MSHSFGTGYSMEWKLEHTKFKSKNKHFYCIWTNSGIEKLSFMFN
jgi:hypothetical protein